MHEVPSCLVSQTRTQTSLKPRTRATILRLFYKQIAVSIPFGDSWEQFIILLAFLPIFMFLLFFFRRQFLLPSSLWYLILLFNHGHTNVWSISGTSRIKINVLRWSNIYVRRNFREGGEKNIMLVTGGLTKRKEKKVNIHDVGYWCLARNVLHRNPWH